MPVSATDDDALFVLTAAMLTPAQFPGVLADDYPAACAELGLEPADDGYGLVFGQDGTGARWTVAISDTALVACALAAWDCGLEYDLSPTSARSSPRCPAGRCRSRWPRPACPLRTIRPRPRTARRSHRPTPGRGGRRSDAWGPTR